MKPAPCACGNPTPSLRVQGRSSDVLTFPDDDGRGLVAVPPLALGTVIDRAPGVELFQLVQTSPTGLQVRLLVAADADPERVWAGGLTTVILLRRDGDPDPHQLLEAASTARAASARKGSLS